MALSFFGLAFITHLWELLVVVLPMMCAGTIVATVNTAQLTKVSTGALKLFGLAFITHLWELLVVVLPIMCAGAIYILLIQHSRLR